MSIYACKTCTHGDNDDQICKDCLVKSDEVPSGWKYRKGSLTNYDLVIASSPERMASFLELISQKPESYEQMLDFLQSEPVFPSKYR